MLNKLFSRDDWGRMIIVVWTSFIIVFFTVMAVILFPVQIIESVSQARAVEARSGYASLVNDFEFEKETIFKLQGEWEYYPNQLYTFDDFTSGRTGEYSLVEFPHFWGEGAYADRVGYATYRMRVRVPSSFDGIGLYARPQYSAYQLFINDVPICGAGVVSEDFNAHEMGLLPTNGYTFYTIGAEGRTLSVILHVQNEANALGGLGNDIFIGSANAIKNIRTFLLMVNGLISGGLLLLFMCFLLIYLNGRERKEYLDYTIVSLLALFISLTSGGESLMHSIGIDNVFLIRLEYCAFITGAFFANYSELKKRIQSKPIFYIIHTYVAAANLFFILVPLSISSRVSAPIIMLSATLFMVPLLSSFKSILVKHSFNAIVSLFSYLIVLTGIGLYILGKIPWGSVDVLSISILIHCVMQMVIFLRRYHKIEQSLKEMTENLEERIIQRTAELTLMKEKAEAATVAKSNFLATMSHEIRTPMNAIMGISDLMRTDNLDDVQLSYLMDIKKSSKALLQIINDILDFSKIEAGKLEIIPVHFNLMAVYDNICSMCHYAADAKGLAFKHSFAPEVPHYIYGDEIRYRQVILNIINNAIKYTKAGFVDFKINKVECCGAPYLAFTVEDTGIGIKEEDFPRLFASFEQLDSASNRKILGTGLGLSITKLLLNLMEGDIQVESVYGEGSVFTALLPLVEGDSAQVSVQETYIPIVANNAKVLVVDDNQINLTVAAGFLAIHNIYPDTASSGREAIAKIQERNYDLVFMDHMMPEMDGIETTHIIRTIEEGRYAKLPIVALTANAVTGASNLFKNAGMDDFLSKPIDAGHMNMILARWLPALKISRMETTRPLIASNEDYDELFEVLYQIGDLDIMNGLSHVAGNKTVYIRILRQFCKEFDSSLAEIKRSLNAEDWDDYAIKLHAMRGVFANLGVARLSEWAFRLEEASKNEEYLLCQLETADFCEHMLFFRDGLIESKLMEVDEKITKMAIDAAELKEKLEELSSVCMLGDSDSAEAIQQALSGRSFDRETDEALEVIYALIASFDFEIVADKIAELLKQLG